MNRLAYLKGKWYILTNNLKCNRTAKERVLSDLLERYSENHRYYHNRNHIFSCLQELDRSHPFIGLYDFTNSCLNSDVAISEIGFFIWFHDAIYIPGSKANESLTADYASEACTYMGMMEGSVERICNNIILSDHTNDPSEVHSRLALDIDLSVLGKPWPIYSHYCRGIREEYIQAQYAADRFRHGRTRFLENLLSKDSIYLTSYYKSKQEDAARENIVRELDNMEQ